MEINMACQTMEMEIRVRRRINRRSFMNSKSSRLKNKQTKILK
jgi:hypothetical protein